MTGSASVSGEPYADGGVQRRAPGRAAKRPDAERPRLGWQQRRLPSAGRQAPAGRRINHVWSQARRCRLSSPGGSDVGSISLRAGRTVQPTGRRLPVARSPLGDNLLVSDDTQARYLSSRAVVGSAVAAAARRRPAGVAGVLPTRATSLKMPLPPRINGRLFV